MDNPDHITLNSMWEAIQEAQQHVITGNEAFDRMIMRETTQQSFMTTQRYGLNVSIPREMVKNDMNIYLDSIIKDKESHIISDNELEETNMEQ